MKLHKNHNFAKMKKLYILLILFFVVQFAFGQSGWSGGQSNWACNDNIPGWGENLGMVSFRTNRTWVVGNQEWSDVVMATGCRKTKFSGHMEERVYGDTDIFRGHTVPFTYRILSSNADCRRNRRRYGNLFSWCAVIRFQDKLCPNDWRVPTIEDFRILHSTLGGHDVSTGLGYNSVIILDKLIRDWGATFGGWSTSKGELRGQRWHARYWTQTEHSGSNVFSFFLNSSGNIIPEDITASKGLGLQVRCVRNKNANDGVKWLEKSNFHNSKRVKRCVW